MRFLLLSGVVESTLGTGSRGILAQETTDSIISLDGKFVAVEFIWNGTSKKPEVLACDTDGFVKVLNVTGSEQRRWKVGGGLAQIALFKASSQADAYAVMGTQGELFFGKLAAPEKVTRVYGGYDRLQFSHDGMWVASFASSVVQVWRTSDWSECLDFRELDQEGNYTGKNRNNKKEMVAFFAKSDAHFLAASGFTNTVVSTWSLPAATKVVDFEGDEGLDRNFIDIATSPDSRWLVAVTTKSNRLVIWDIASRKIVARPIAFPTGVGNRLAFSGDGKILVCSQCLHSIGSRTGFRVYRVNNWDESRRFVVNKDAQLDNGRVSEKLVKEWDDLAITNLSVDFTGSNIATVHGDKCVRLWSIPPK